MAIIKNKHITFSLVLLCLIVVSPMANAQIGGINVPIINGILFCTINGAPLNGTSAPAFANAVVQLQCGSQNTVVAETITSITGLFTFSTNGIQISLPTLLNDCRIVVPTPRSSCNSTLPSTGQLISQLNLVGSLISGLLNIVANLPTGFVPTV
ncbi:hypothetical protein ISN44_As08g018240 [Arabidopsis suecica]|uniref:Pollen Ole e 1 allergen and extensin family protein n=1 Tax=Arabidopsis suecica TaxID=45249 RepID=A0A8T2B9F6_ARASU|nr:hypothetical protein ISN44_As08g018240 [Arabidopsis suecica]